jgi:hypothetical protein
MSKSLIDRSYDIVDALEELQIAAEEWAKSSTISNSFERKKRARDLAMAAVRYTQTLQNTARGAK